MNNVSSGRQNIETGSFGNEDQQTVSIDIPREQRHAAPDENKSDETENKPELFYFDPNRISGNDWRRLGLPDKLILTISHYLQKGGSFRAAADLKKLYGLKADDFERLFPYVQNPEFRKNSLFRCNTPNLNSIRNITGNTTR